MSTIEGDGKCSEDNVVIREGIYYFKLFIKVLEADMDANVLFLVREIITQTNCVRKTGAVIFLWQGNYEG